MKSSNDQCNTSLKQRNRLSKHSQLQLYNRFCTAVSKTWCDAPSHRTLLLLAPNWHQEESAKQRKWHGCPHSAHKPNNGLIRDTILWSLRRSAFWQALPLCLNTSSIWWILHKDLHYHPYKIQVPQELHEQDRVSRLHFCDKLLGFVNNNYDTMEESVMSHKAHLH